MKRHGWRLTRRGELVVGLAFLLFVCLMVGLAGGIEAGVWP